MNVDFNGDIQLTKPVSDDCHIKHLKNNSSGGRSQQTRVKSVRLINDSRVFKNTFEAAI